MSLLNTGLNVLGTAAVLRSFAGRNKPDADNRMNRFMSEMRSNGIARTNLFDITIPIPRMLLLEQTTDRVEKKLSLYAETAQLPGVNIQTDNIKTFGVGPMEAMPYSIQTNDLTLTFLGDGKGYVYKFFYQWLHQIVRGDSAMTVDTVSKNNLSPYEVEFKDQYSVDLTLYSYNEQSQVIFEYKIYDAFPKNLPDISLSWQDQSNYMQFGVTFSYLRAELLNVSEAVQGTQNGFKGLNTLQKLVKIGTALQTLKTLRKPTSLQDALASTTTVRNVSGAWTR